jgi:hypothetical protein
VDPDGVTLNAGNSNSPIRPLVPFAEQSELRHRVSPSIGSEQNLPTSTAVIEAPAIATVSEKVDAASEAVPARDRAERAVKTVPVAPVVTAGNLDSTPPAGEVGERVVVGSKKRTAPAHAEKQGTKQYAAAESPAKQGAGLAQQPGETSAPIAPKAEPIRRVARRQGDAESGDELNRVSQPTPVAPKPQQLASMSGEALPARTELSVDRVDEPQPVAPPPGESIAARNNPASSQSPRLPASASETLSRFELARQRVRTMVRYFRDDGTALSEWGDDQGQLTAKRERDALHARNEQNGIGLFAIDPPRWRVSDTSVALEATYHVSTGQVVAESGQFHLDMDWQDGGWKITRVEVSPSR